MKAIDHSSPFLGQKRVRCARQSEWTDSVRGPHPQRLQSDPTALLSSVSGITELVIATAITVPERSFLAEDPHGVVAAKRVRANRSAGSASAASMAWLQFRKRAAFDKLIEPLRRGDIDGQRGASCLWHVV